MTRYSIKKKFQIAYAHRLLNYNGKCENLHGHNGKIEVIIESDKLDAQSMVMDFAEVKKRVKNWLDENLDHRVLLSEKDPLVDVLSENQQKIFTTKDNPTAEVIAITIMKEMTKRGINVKEVRFWENETSMASVKKE